MNERAFYRLCSSCKRELIFGGRYYTCSVSTCTRAKDPLTFCSLPCFEAHVPVIRHREAWAEEQKAPSREQWQAGSARAKPRSGHPRRGPSAGCGQDERPQASSSATQECRAKSGSREQAQAMSERVRHEHFGRAMDVPATSSARSPTGRFRRPPPRAARRCWTATSERH